jgi:hypothetical protein
MDNTHLAEWFLTQVSSKDRATEIIGDHLEQRGTTLSLALTVLRITFALQWRWLIALPVAGVAMMAEISPYASMFFAKGFSDGFSGNPPSDVPALPLAAGMASTVGLFLATIAICLWSTCALALVRYGLRSSIARLGLLLAVLFTLGSCFMWANHALVVIPATLSVVLVLALADPQGRRILACMAVAGSVYWAGFMLLATALSRIILIDGARQLNAISYIGYTLCVVAEAFALAQSRRWLLPASC